MISCEHCEELINARLDGDLTDEDALLLEDHLAQCADCRKLDRDLTSLHGHLQALPFEPPEDLIPSVMARLEPDTIQPVKKKKRPWVAAVCAAAVVLLAVAVTPQILPFGDSAESATAGDTAGAPETMVMDGEPAEGCEAAPAPEESQTAAEEEMLKPETLTREQALEVLEDYLAGQSRTLSVTQGTLSADENFWLFSTQDGALQFSVARTDGSVEETSLP